MRLPNPFRRPTRTQEARRPDEDLGWRPASAFGATPLNPDRDELNGENLLRAAYEAYTTNPLGYAVIEQQTSFVLGGGARVIATDPRVQKIIDSFWHHPENAMPLRLYSLQTELALFGEQFIRFFADPLTGRTVIRQLDPLYITAIETDPDDLEKPLRYLYNPPSLSPLSSREMRVNAPFPEGTMGAEGGALGGGEVWLPAADVLHVTINKVSSSLRGRSDLAPIIPWLRRYSTWLEDRARQNRYKSALVWDLTATGPEEIQRLRASYATPPPSGSVLVHNEREVWKPLSPEIHAGDAALDGRAIRLMVATGAILPEHFLAEGGNANRATAAEMGLPTTKRFQRRQQVFRAFLAQIVDRVLREARRAGRLGPRVNRAYAIQFEELSPIPVQGTAGALRDLSEALTQAIAQQLITVEAARRMFLRFAAQADESASQPQDPPA